MTRAVLALAIGAVLIAVILAADLAVRRLLAPHTGSHRPARALRVPFICGHCEDGAHGIFCEQRGCECACGEPQVTESLPWRQPWRQRLSARLAEVRAWLARADVPGEKEVMPDSPRRNAQGRSGSPENVPRPADTCSVAAGEAAEPARSRKSGDGPGPGHPDGGAIIRTAQVQGVFLPLTAQSPPPQAWLSPPRAGPWVPARPRVRVPVAETALDVFTGEQAAWLRELLADGLGGYGSVGEYMAAATAKAARYLP